MRILTTSRSLTGNDGPYAIAIGIFDGLHLGHQALLSKAVELAKADGIQSLAYTFDPHPARSLSPGAGPKLLEPLEVRFERFSALQLDAVLVERFSQQFAAIKSDAFISDTLVGKLHAQHLIVGKGFTFGADRTGNAEVLRAAGGKHGFTTHLIDPIQMDGEDISSSRIRKLVTAGDLPGAAKLLGRPFSLVGSVARGAMRGKSIGFPTANLEPTNEVTPATGVYAARIEGEFGRFPGVVNVGFAPTFEEGEEDRHLKIEAHLLDFESRPLYGEHLTIEFLEQLRGEQRFENAEALKQQIEKDIVAARKLLASNPEAP